ncbi:MAG TPA: hypothetical protein VE620_10970 [Myxococcales bacterium]|nr:hypothetical protein [Myxococcales bacterium]
MSESGSAVVVPRRWVNDRTASSGDLDGRGKGEHVDDDDDV